MQKAKTAPPEVIDAVSPPPPPLTAPKTSSPINGAINLVIKNSPTSW